MVLSVIIRIPHTLRRQINGQREIMVQPGLLIDIFKEIKEKYPELSKAIFDGNNVIKSFIMLHINKQFIGKPSEYSSTIRDNQVIHLIIPISGG
jgi:hypothetical protein